MDQITSCCTRCGRPIVFGAGASVQCCVACGCLNERPRAQGPTLDLLRRATEQRLRCDFANAENSYQHVLLDYPDQTDAIRSFLVNRLGDSTEPAQQRKAIDALLRRGHSYSTIKRVLSDLQTETDFFLEEE